MAWFPKYEDNPVYQPKKETLTHKTSIEENDVSWNDIEDFSQKAFNVACMFYSTEQLDELNSKMKEITSSIKVETLFTENGLTWVTETVFGNKLLTEFIMKVSNLFRTYLAFYVSSFDDIIECFARAFSMDESDMKFCLIPSSILQSFEFDHETIYNVLRANPWLIVILIMISVKIEATHESQ